MTLKPAGLLAVLAFLAAPAVAGQIRLEYPPAAMKAGEQGTVAVTVGTDGRVKDCTVTQSSGYHDLDEATCTDFVKYARFNPAKDDKGNPKEGSFSTRVEWKLRR